ncbi:MAG: hypothetical protein WDM96_04800 [Lacunisphaera sp.]
MIAGEVGGQIDGDSGFADAPFILTSEMILALGMVGSLEQHKACRSFAMDPISESEPGLEVAAVATPLASRLTTAAP